MKRDQLNGDQTGRMITTPMRRIERLVFQASHGFSEGDPIRHTGTEWVAADADDLTDLNRRATGVVESARSNSFTVVMQGFVRFQSELLTAGEVHWLASGGGIEDAQPAYTSQPILAALSTTDALILLGNPTALATALPDNVLLATTTYSTVGAATHNWNAAMQTALAIIIAGGGGGGGMKTSGSGLLLAAGGGGGAGAQGWARFARIAGVTPPSLGVNIGAAGTAGGTGSSAGAGTDGGTSSLLVDSIGPSAAGGKGGEGGSSAAGTHAGRRGNGGSASSSAGEMDNGSGAKIRWHGVTQAGNDGTDGRTHTSTVTITTTPQTVIAGVSASIGGHGGTQLAGTAGDGGEGAYYQAGNVASTAGLKGRIIIYEFS